MPLALVTATSMLAMDLFLPAVPALQTALGTDIGRAQGTVSVFLTGLAASQLLWGEALNRIGPQRCVGLSVALLVASSAGCALATSVEMLLALRLLQGVAAGAATVVASSVVRATLSDAEAVRGLATIASIEAIVPAAGPVLGAVLLAWSDWRLVFWVLAGATLAVLPVVWRVTPARLPGFDARVPARYRDLWANRRFMRLALSHALCIGALLTFVGSAPQWLQRAHGLGPNAFAGLQVVGVAGFIAMASQAGRLSQRLGAVRAVRAGAWLHCGLCAALLVVALAGMVSLAGVVVFWCAFCGLVGLRGPVAFGLAMKVPPSQMGRASGLIVLLLLVAGAAGTQGVAPFIDGPSMAPLAGLLLAMNLASLMLVSVTLKEG